MTPAVTLERADSAGWSRVLVGRRWIGSLAVSGSARWVRAASRREGVRLPFALFDDVEGAVRALLKAYLQ